MRSTSKTRDMFVFYMSVEIGFCCVVFVLRQVKKKFYTKRSSSQTSHISPNTNFSLSRSDAEISPFASMRIRSRISSTKILLSQDNSS